MGAMSVGRASDGRRRKPGRCLRWHIIKGAKRNLETSDFLLHMRAYSHVRLLTDALQGARRELSEARFLPA